MLNKEIIEIDSISIKKLIYEIRGKQVMLDSDLANLYQVETKNLNKAVKRNINRFPENFRFQLTVDEFEFLRSQFVTSKKEYGRGGRRYNPYVFTEQGISMLSAVLKSDVAISVSISIINTFVEMRKFINSNMLMFEKINLLESKQNEYEKESRKIGEILEKNNDKILQNEEKIEKIFEIFKPEESKNKYIFYKGQIYDAFNLLVDLVKSAKNKIILIDNYVDIETLNILCKKNIGVEIVIFSSNKLKLSEIDIEKFNKQYSSLKLKITNNFHDRFLVIDDKTVYHIGASLKDAGKKTFGVSKWEDEDITNELIKKLK